MNSRNTKTDLEATRSNLLLHTESCLPDSASEWLKKALQIVSGSKQVIEDLGLYSAMAKRKVGTDQLDTTRVKDTKLPLLDIHHWLIADCVRLALVITAIQSNPAAIETIISSYYKMGDESERIALIQGLILFAPSEYITEIALDAGRTNNLELLSALALENPFPASFYNEQSFNQMVLKALFQGLAIERVVDLEQRANAELSRMCESYVIEREEAGRSVPVDIWLAIGPCASEAGQQQMINYIKHDNTGHRYYCTLALSKRLSQDPSIRTLLEERLRIEQQPMILNLLQETTKNL